MTWKFIRRKINALKLRNKPVLVACVAVFGMGALLYASYMANSRICLDPTAYTPLLRLIAQAESNDNYNAYFGKAENTTIDFTSMSVTEVLAWQAEFVCQGSPSSAVGRYQIINTTLSGLVRQLDIDTAQKFDRSMQDKLAIALLERRGANAYANKEITKEVFASNLAKEWAALPKVIGTNPNESHYASDGLNRSRVSVNVILSVIERMI